MDIHSDIFLTNRYFVWVREIQSALKEWQDILLHYKANYDQVLLYASNLTHLFSLGNTFCAASLVYDAQDIDQMKTDFLSQFETLNVILLKYIPDTPDAKWCTLPLLLQEYGVHLSHNLEEMIAKFVRFPGEEKPLQWNPLVNLMSPSTTGKFQPGHDISLQLSKGVSLLELAELITELSNFQQPLLPHLQMLIFFELHKSIVFDKYLHFHAEKMQCQTQESVEATVSLSASQPGGTIEKEAAAMKGFVQNLEKTKELLCKVMNGEAKYSEIIVEGELDLENLDIANEFAILVEYSCMNSLSCTGLSGVQSMPELFQYSNHIHNIEQVCHQYDLHGCLNDPKLEQLTHLASELRLKDIRANLTPNDASKKLAAVKRTLFFSERTNSNCLDLFAVVRESAAFYQFIWEKQFYGVKGVAYFIQQYLIIAAQLQHNDYYKLVLDHLCVAFKLISPFMDTSQDLGTLMGKVLELDLTNGLMQLETVNANITLIKLWFSRLEVCVMHTRACM